jgi:glycosyltransferase involved in cell wall biosynthesis
LHIDTGTAWRGGQQQVLLLLQGCQARGMEQLLLAGCGSPLSDRARKAGLDVAELALPILSRANWRSVRDRVEEFDLIHAHDAAAHTLALAARHLGTQKRIPLVVARRVGFPIPPRGRIKYRFATRYIAVSEHVRQRLLETGVPAKKVSVIFDGVPSVDGPPTAEERAARRARARIDDATFLVGTLTSLAPEKLPNEHLEMLAQLPSWVRLWVGVPAADLEKKGKSAALLDAAAAKGVRDRLEVVPVEEDGSAFLHALDLFVYLSRSEGLGSAILLAMAHGLPVVASRVGGIPETVRHLETGILVDNPADLPTAILLLKGSPELRSRLASGGREFVLANATSDRMVARTVAVYEEILGSGPS